MKVCISMHAALHVAIYKDRQVSLHSPSHCSWRLFQSDISVRACVPSSTHNASESRHTEKTKKDNRILHIYSDIKQKRVHFVRKMNFIELVLCRHYDI